ncbi:MAG: hypothetical protein E7109_02195 [Bacteroidales bacterium]|nr:hypothetical protein [Bacteroidales bacterium]
MRTNTFIKALAFAMLLATACNKSEIANEENTEKKGFALPVTVNVTREGDDATKATYTDNGDGTGSLGFSTGDKLFVSGIAGGYDYEFAGTLDYVSEGTFSGTIYTSKEWTGTADALFTVASDDGFVNATLLPAGYESYGYLYIQTYDEYNDEAAQNNTYTLATSKAAGVEQFSYEKAISYSSGFALTPKNAILNFTITGLAASTNVAVSLTGSGYTITKTVTTDASGNATFAAGVSGGEDLNNFSLTVGGTPITLVTESKTLTAGKIYNITRSAVPAGNTVDVSSLTGNYTAQNGDILTGELKGNYKISISDGATVTLNDATIEGTNNENYDWAGITCEGNATIYLSGTNSVKGFWENYPGIYVPVNKTVTILGTGSLTASSNGWGAGIGGGYNLSSGSVLINSGTIVASGGREAAGIGSGGSTELVGVVYCGTITITGGDVTATGGVRAAGIGSGCAEENTNSICGAITITNTVTRVTATKGADAPNSIGAGQRGTCGTVTIGGVKGVISESPYTYIPSI